MPIITVSVDDELHSQHEECIQLMDDSGAYDWDDFKELIEDEEVEVDFDELLAWRERNGH